MMDQNGKFGDEKELAFEEVQLSFCCFDVALDGALSIMPSTGTNSVTLKSSRENKGYERLEITRSDDLLRSKDSEEDGNNFVRRIVVMRLEVAFIFFFEGFPVQANDQQLHQRRKEDSALIHV